MGFLLPKKSESMLALNDLPLFIAAGFIMDSHRPLQTFM